METTNTTKEKKVKKLKTRKRENIVTKAVKISEREATALDSACKETSITASRFIRSSIVNELKRFNRDQLNYGKKVYIIDDNILYYMSKISNSLNQIAKGINTIAKFEDVPIAGYYENLVKLDAVLEFAKENLINKNKEGNNAI